MLVRTGLGMFLTAVLVAGSARSAPADDLPAPFQRFSRQSLLRLLYPDEATAAVVRETRIWKGGPTLRELWVWDRAAGEYREARN